MNTNERTMAWITGVVIVTRGVVVPGAAVKVNNMATEFSCDDKTNDDGSFRAARLQFGIYTVIVEPAGFKTFFPNNINIDINKLLAKDLTLEVGGVNETVTV